MRQGGAVVEGGWGWEGGGGGEEGDAEAAGCLDLRGGVSWWMGDLGIGMMGWEDGWMDQ